MASYDSSVVIKTLKEKTSNLKLLITSVLDHGVIQNFIVYQCTKLQTIIVCIKVSKLRDQTVLCLFLNVKIKAGDVL